MVSSDQGIRKLTGYIESRFHRINVLENLTENIESRFLWSNVLES